MIDIERAWVVGLPDGVTFQQLVDLKKIILIEYYVEMTRQVLMHVIKEVPVIEFSERLHIEKEVELKIEQGQWINKEVKYHEGMSVKVPVVVEEEEYVHFEEIKHVQL